MSSDEESHSGSDSEEEVIKKPIKREPSETELAMKKRREAQQNTAGLDDAAKELLASNRQDRVRMEEEIKELRDRAERRKREREIEEKRMAAERVAEDERRKAAEETKRKQKSEEEEKRQRERAKKLAEFEKLKNPPKPNFVITKKSGDGEEEEVEEEEKVGKNKKSKQQLEAEKKAILSQRIIPLDTNGMNSSKLTEKAKELLNMIYKLEGEKYDLEKHFKAQQFDMMELAEKARQINKVGKGGLKRVQHGPDDPVDKIQERFAGAPSKVEMYSKYERQKDKREYSERMVLFTGPTYSLPVERIKPQKIVDWDEEGMPIYAGVSKTDDPE